jgi:hypothetical protein
MDGRQPHADDHVDRAQDRAESAATKAELVAGLDLAGHKNASDSLRDLNRFPEGTKSTVLGVLNDWLDEAKSEALAAETGDLRSELDADITEGRG